MQVSDDVRRRLDSLARATPEWRTWLGLLAETLRGVSDPGWDSIGPSLAPTRAAAAPLLAEAEITLDLGLAREWLGRLLETAARAGGPGAASLHGATDRLDSRRFLEAAVCQDLEAVASLGTDSGADPKALGALAGLAVMPLLQACGRRLAAGHVPATWAHGYCPICGAWPLLAEIRGLERSVRLRCGRCGGDWRSEWLRCPYCGTADHERLGSLVSDSHGETRKVETCEECRGYLKTLTTLQPWAPETVALEDLATIDLDVAALGRGYTRPERPGYVLGARLVEGPSDPRPSAARRRGLFRRRG